MKNYLNKILISFFTVISLGFSQDNNSLSFDGNSHVLIPADLLENDEPRTILAQIKNNGGGTIYSNFSNETGMYELSESNDGPLFRLNGQSGWETAGENTTNENGEWVYVIGTWDLNQIKVYKNGILIDSNNLNGPLSQNTFDGSDGDLAGIGASLTMDGGSDEGAGYYNGNIAKVAVWNTVLNEEEISELCN